MILPKVRDPRFITVRRGGTLEDSDHHLLAFWAADCAEHVLGLFELARPHAIVTRTVRGAGDPRPIPDDAFERRLVVARRRLEAAVAAEAGRLAEISVPSASARTIVYKGLVAGGRLAELYPDLAAPLSVGYAVFHQRYATNTRPVWRLAQPFRSIAHNGEINTVRGNREQVRGRSADPAPTAIARSLLEAGPLLSADGSDSLSLDESLELLMIAAMRASSSALPNGLVR